VRSQVITSLYKRILSVRLKSLQVLSNTKINVFLSPFDHSHCRSFWWEINFEREPMKKLLPILLFTAVVSGSLFMILESGEYYQKFYKNEYQGYWAAFLVESFLAIAAMLNVKNKKLLNLIIMLVMIPLFLVMVLVVNRKTALSGP
jgi:hypothetical protein